MKLSDFKVGFRLLAREPAYSSIVIFSLSVAFGVSFLIFGFAIYSFSYDEKISESDKIYILKTRFNTGQAAKWNGAAPQVLRTVVKESGMGAKASAFVVSSKSMRMGDIIEEVELTYVDQDFVDIFSLHAMEGDLTKALTSPNGLAITTKTAGKLFGSTHAVGRTLKIGGELYEVMAVLPDPPAATTAMYAALAGVNSNAWPAVEREDALASWSSIYGRVYIKLAQNGGALAMTERLQHAADDSPYRAHLPTAVIEKLGAKKPFDVQLEALPAVYFDADFDYLTNSSTHGNKNVVFGLMAVGGLILLLASINYINLTTVRTLRRQREIAMRKVLGAGAGRVVSQFLAESVLVSLFAMAGGLALAAIFAKSFFALIDRNIDHLFSPAAILLSALIAILVGILAGSYPAWVALKVPVGQVLAGRGDTEAVGGIWLRRVLTVAQFATAMGLAGVTLAIAWQANFATKIDPGFDAAALVHIDLPKDMRSPESRGFRDALLRTPGVAGTTAALDAVGRQNGYLQTTIRFHGDSYTWQIKGVTPEFFDTYRLHAVSGRLFDPRVDGLERPTAAVINKAAAAALGFSSPDLAVGSFLDVKYWEAPQKIVGIAPDIRHQNLHDKIKPLIYLLTDEASVLTVRADGDVGAMEDALAAIWNRYFPNDVLKTIRGNNVFAKNYADDVRLAKLLFAATVVAMVIAAFGIYVLSAYSVRRRSKEIVLRKLFGANGKAIAIFVGKEFAVLFVVSASIGLPISAIATQHYLAGFSERAPIGIWALAVAFSIAGVAAILSVLRHTLTAIHASPADILR